MQNWIRAFWRFFYFITSTIIHIAGYVFLILLGKPKKIAAARMRRDWLDHVPDNMGLDLEITGEPYHGTALFVANHISYIDPILIWKHIEADVVAKSEIKKWPLVGLAGYIIGTIFVKRESKSSRLKTAGIIRQTLEEGTSILVFPEGTTTDGSSILPFRPRAFEAAFLADVPVQPIRISFEDPEVPFIGDDTFIPHFFRLFRLKKIKANLFFGPLLSGENTRIEAEQWIASGQSSLSMNPA